jgi:hypothetical protein
VGLIRPDGGLSAAPADDGRQLTPIGQWRVDERLIVERPAGPELVERETAALWLQASPLAPNRFFARRWVDAASPPLMAWQRSSAPVRACPIPLTQLPGGPDRWILAAMGAIAPASS